MTLFLQGVTWQSLKPHTGLWPLFAIMSAGMVFVGAYIVRLATKTTDIQGRSNSHRERQNLLNVLYSVMILKEKCVEFPTFLFS